MGTPLGLSVFSAPGFVAPSSAARRAVGLFSNARVLTMEGDRPVTQLKSGDRIIARDIGTICISGVAIAEAICTPVRIKSGSLGHRGYARDAVIAPGTLIHLRDWRAPAIYGAASADVPAHTLVDGQFIRIEPRRRALLYRLILEEPHIIYAEGLELTFGPGHPFSAPSDDVPHL